MVLSMSTAASKNGDTTKSKIATVNIFVVVIAVDKPTEQSKEAACGTTLERTQKTTIEGAGFIHTVGSAACFSFCRGFPFCRGFLALCLDVF